ncbi:MAG TPA: peptidoglycan DD-metalloendopeptidase family protein, partial [Candidatus Deferrimicrobiaceae bacterium]
LSETLRKEKKSRARVGDLKERFDRQRRFIVEIDRKLSILSVEMDRTEAEVKALEARQERTRRQLGDGVHAAFLVAREPSKRMLGDAPGNELRREFAVRLLSLGRRHLETVTADRERKADQLSGIEQKIELSERQMAREKKVGETLQSRQEAERAKLAEIEAQKKRKKAELADLRARIARMDSLVSRIEREARNRERAAQEKESRQPEKPAAGGRKREVAPKRFAALQGGMSAPLSGKVVGRFGRQHDPVFDVDVENRGVEIEAESGSAIKAVGKGEVVFVGTVAGFGKVLILQHGSGLFSVYGKAGSFSLRQGRSVGAGDEIGRLPSDPSGKSVLYLELRAGGTAIDPLSVITIP